MAIGEYLKTASAYLIRAYDARRMEIKEKQREITRKEEELRNQIDELEREKLGNQQEMGDSDNDDAERIRKLAQNNNIENQIQQARQDFENEKARISQEIKDMEDDAADIKRHADDFLNRAAKG